jgi:hypothetical protein
VVTDKQLTQQTPPTQTVTVDDVVKALSRLGSLNYQHRQMLKDGDVLSVLEQFVAARQSTDWIFVGGKIVCALYFVFGLLDGQLNWIAAIILPLLIWPHSKQKQTIKEVTSIVRQFADANGYQAPTHESQLLAELRLHHSLNYQQNKLLKAGDPITVGREIVKSIRRGAWLRIVFMSLASLPQLGQIVLKGVEIRNGTSASWSPIWVGIYHCAFMLIFAIASSVSQFKRARRLEFLMGEHPVEMEALRHGTESETDQLSPYRSPQFR